MRNLKKPPEQKPTMKYVWQRKIGTRYSRFWRKEIDTDILISRRANKHNASCMQFDNGECWCNVVIWQYHCNLIRIRAGVIMLTRAGSVSQVPGHVIDHVSKINIHKQVI